jgi:hypothetical protein
VGPPSDLMWLRLATIRNGALVGIQDIDKNGKAGRDSSTVRVDSLGKVHIGYFQYGEVYGECPMYATDASGSWVLTQLNPLNSGGSWGNMAYGTPTLALDVRDNPSMLYARQGDTGMRYAVKGGSGWTWDEIVTSGGGGYRVDDPCLVLDSRGNPMMAYRGHDNNQIYFTAAVTPTVASLAPASKPVGGAAFTLTVFGTNFLSTSAVLWNGSARTTSYLSATQLTAQIIVGDIASSGQISVTVSNPAPSLGVSNSKTFGVQAPASIVYVDGSYTPESCGVHTWGYDAFTNIQAGASAAAIGGTIYVAAGTYAGNITINKSLILIGDPGDATAGPGPNAPVIDGGSLPGSGFFIANGVSGVTIKGFEIRNFTSDDTGIGNGISAWEAGTTNVTPSRTTTSTISAGTESWSETITSWAVTQIGRSRPTSSRRSKPTGSNSPIQKTRTSRTTSSTPRLPRIRPPAS